MKDELLGFDYLPDEARSILNRGETGHYTSFDGSWEIWVGDNGDTTVRMSGSGSAVLMGWPHLLAFIVPLALALTGVGLSIAAL